MEGNQYVFRVSAENEVGIGEPAELSQSITTKSPFGKSTACESIHNVLSMYDESGMPSEPFLLSKTPSRNKFTIQTPFICTFIKISVFY